MATKPILVDLDMQSAAKVTNLPTPTASGDAVNKAYVDSAVEGLAWKDSVRVATASNINLAAPGATVDGVTMATNDRMLVRAQSAGAENGIYIWNGAATPATRSLDCSTADELEQAITSVEEGTSAGSTFRQTVVNATLNTTTLTWTTFGSVAPAATESTAGVAEIATQGETDTGSDDLRMVTPLKLATYSGRAKRYASTFGDGSATSYVITHNLNTIDVDVTVWEVGGSKRVVECEVRNTSVNSVTLLFNAAPASNALRAVVTA
jgi:hypothetical protein